MKPTAAAFCMGLVAGWAMGPAPPSRGTAADPEPEGAARHDFDAVDVALEAPAEERLIALRAELELIEALDASLGVAPEPLPEPIAPSDPAALIPLTMPP